LEKAGAKGDSQAYNELGLIYQDESSNLSTGTILNDIGCCKATCKATQENRDKAMEYFKKAAAVGNANAYVNMGKYCESECAPEEYFKKAGELGDAQGYIKLAQMEGTLLSKSIEYLKAAGDLGDEDGYSMLGDIYFYGGWGKDENDPSAAHIPRDYKRAAHYYKKCADMGNGYCYLSLSDMYKKGLGVQKDRKKARAYANHGNAILCDMGSDSACEGDEE
uniref:tetratricopeptide repeat protein n=1 Tax=Helicobacter vulpis TaxID=2316076 RepID=UPI0013CE29AF